MIRFVEGPAKGTVLQLTRAPFLLRVVIGESGEVDALDQPTDEAKANETICVYRLTCPPGSMHVCRSPRSQSGWSAVAEYEPLYEQPRDEDVRTTPAWNQFCERNRKDLVAGTWAEGKVFA